MDRKRLEFVLDKILDETGIKYKKNDEHGYYLVWSDDEMMIYFVVNKPKNYNELAVALTKIYDVTGKYNEFGYLLTKYLTGDNDLGKKYR